MTILVDTSVLIDHLRGDPAARAALAGAAGSGRPMVGSVVTRVEVLAGMRPSERQPTRRLLDALGWEPVGVQIADRAGELANHFLRSHPGVDPIDYIIAATAERLGAELWTRNVKHFPMFPGLRSPY